MNSGRRSSSASSNKGPNRSVVDYESDEQLKRALLSMDAPSKRISRPSSPNNENSHQDLDWVLHSYDADSTEVQSMHEELKRLQILKTYLILDSEREEAFERVTSIAARTFNVPIALVSLVDLGRQWFMSNHGLPYETRETPRRHAFCAHAILSKPPSSAASTTTGNTKPAAATNLDTTIVNQQHPEDSTMTSIDETTAEGAVSEEVVETEEVEQPRKPTPMLVVPDATNDFRFQDNPLVTGPPNIRFYAGAPLMSPEGYKLGTLCIIDSKVRMQGLDDDEKIILQDLAAMTVQIMVERRYRIENDSKNKSPAQLIAYTAHDLITPLTGVQLSLSLLKEDTEVKHILGPHRMELLQTAATCSDLMLRICQTAMEGLRGQLNTSGDTDFSSSSDPVANFLQSRLGNNNNNRNNNNYSKNDDDDDRMMLSSDYSAISITKMDDLIRSLHMIIDPIQKKVPVIISLDKSIPNFVVGDDLKLFRCALNLLSNASSRTNTGSIHLRIYPRAEQLQHDMITHPMLLFECEDTGNDIECADYPTLFQPTNASLSSSSSSFIGLSSVASLVDSMDGEYGFRPRGLDLKGEKVLDSKGRQYQGAIFWFGIPLIIPESNQRPIGETTLGVAVRRNSFALLDEAEGGSGGGGGTEATITLAATFDQFNSSTSTTVKAAAAAAMLRASSHDSMSRGGSSTSSFGNLKTRATIRVDNNEQANAINESCLNAIFTTHVKQPPSEPQPQQNATTTTTKSSSLWDLSSPAESVVACSNKNVNVNFLQSFLQSTNVTTKSNNTVEKASQTGREMLLEGHDANADPITTSSSTATASVKAVTTTTNDVSRDINTITNATATAASTAVIERTIAKRERRALVIDDSVVVRKSLARALNKVGFPHVALAVDGMEGLKEMKKQLYDIVLCDFLMPVMDGLDCVKQYRTWEEQNRVWFRQLIIGISAHANMNDCGQGLQAGMDDFRPKPITIKTLSELEESEACTAISKQLDEIELNEGKGGTTFAMDDFSQRPEDSVRNGQIMMVVDGGGASSLSRTRDGNDTTIATNPATAATSNHNSKKTQSSQGLEASDTKRQRQQTSVCLIATDTPTLQSNQVLTSLESNGWKVVVVHEGKDALRLLQMRNWDAVLIDDDISDVNGQTCITAFREWEEQNRVNGQKNMFLVCDGDIPSPYDTSAIIQPPSGYNGVLKKPVAWKDLQYLLERNGVDSGMDIVVRN